jgi:hypothetical protein
LAGRPDSDPDPDLTDGERAFIDFLIAETIQRHMAIPVDDVATAVAT